MEFVPDCKIEVKNGRDAENAAMKALRKDYRSVLGGGTEWFTAQTRQENDLIETYKDAVEPHKKI